MKVQRFYPLQVARKLNNRTMDTLDKGEAAALKFFFLKGRKYNLTVAITSADKPVALPKAENAMKVKNLAANIDDHRITITINRAGV